MLAPLVTGVYIIMSQAQLNDFYAAVVPLVVALCSYIAYELRQAQSDRQTKHEEVVKTMTALHPKEQINAAPGKKGGGARTYPLYNQNDDPAANGTLPPGGNEECGEECCAMVIQYQHGVSVEADYLRYLLRGPNGSPLTDATDLVAVLAKSNVTALAISPPSNTLPAVIRALTASRQPAIILGNWIDPGVLHWVLITDSTATDFTYNDPWGGFRRTRTWAELEAIYGGWIVRVTRKPDA